MAKVGTINGKVAVDKNGKIVTVGTDPLITSMIERTIVELYVPNGITKLGKNSFQNCLSLEKVVLSNSVVTLEESAFRFNTKLKSVDLKNVVTIGEYVFNNCTALNYLEIPNTVTSIGIYALTIGSNNNKATIVFKSITPPNIIANTFNANFINKILVPKGYGDTYKQATNWTAFADYIFESEE